MERLAVNALVAFALCVLAMPSRARSTTLMGDRTQATNVWWIWWTRVPFYRPKDLQARLRGSKTLSLSRTPRRRSGGRKGGSRDAHTDDELGGDRTPGLGGRGPGGASGTQPLMGSRPRMVPEPATDFALWM